MPDDPKELWEREKKICIPVEEGGPRDLADYTERIQEGVKIARRELYQSDESLPSNRTLQAVHEDIFGEVYPFAGEFRDGEYLVTFGPNSAFSGAYYSRIEENLDSLFEQTSELFSNATFLLDDKEQSAKDHAQALTFYSTQLHVIHPFQNGNSRVSLIVTEALANRYLPGKEHNLLSLDPIDAYRADRTYAQQCGVIKPLAKTLFGVDIPKESPHKIGVLPYDLLLELKDKRGFVSLACGEAKDVLNWREKLRSDMKLAELISAAEPGTAFTYQERTIHITETEEQAKKAALHQGKRNKEQNEFAYTKEELQFLRRLNTGPDFER